MTLTGGDKDVGLALPCSPTTSVFMEAVGSEWAVVVGGVDDNDKEEEDDEVSAGIDAAFFGGRLAGEGKVPCKPLETVVPRGCIDA